jgi:cytochrome c556|tara:strand:- start:590 stop:1027 length:438 start_codon:yes stop_codon:yes gene_type:complete
MNIKIIFFLISIPFIALAHEVNIENKEVEQIVKERMGKMSKIKALSTKMYPLTMSGEFEEIKEFNERLLHNAKEFKQLFPEGSQGGKASSLIWEDRETFNLYIDNFINSIESIGISIENEDSVSLIENFNIMASNCGTCHKKFKN